MASQFLLEFGEHLFRQGASPGSMYVLLSGKLQVIADGVPIATLGEPGSFVGELSFLTGRPRTADVVALSRCQVLEVTDMESFFRDDSTRAVAVARGLAQRLDAMDRRFLHMRELAAGGPSTSAVEAVVRVLHGEDSGDATVVGSRLL